ncbi:MAG: UDP-2,3-diacylglucosamine diphosphatase [Betaproteobacteria bacterium]|nr:UDP-2,3-diacylglucosamine diphosphatase [Betaproteobacteria bacterium]
MGEAARGASLPAFFEFTAPTAWRAVDFISDLHLCEAMPATFQAWERHLRQTTADAVFILGDLFEVWVGDDARNRPFERRCVDVLAHAASHCQLAFMAGNRDFLVGATLLREAGLMALPDPTVLSAWGQPVLLSHGDALCLSDTPYQAFRREVRSPAWQSAFLAKPLADRLALAAEMRRASAQRWQAENARGERRFGLDGDDAADVDPAEAVRWMHALGAAEMVHGHTHRPGSEVLAPGFKRHVLSDWDLDSAHRAEVLRLTRRGFERLRPTGI